MIPLNLVNEFEERKPLTANAIANVQDPIRREILKGVMPLATSYEPDAWQEIVFMDGFSEEIAGRLLNLGVTMQEMKKAESFAVQGVGDTLTIYANTARGTLYGVCEILRQAQNGKGAIPGGLWFAAPQCTFRGLKLYLPAQQAINQFYKIIDMLVYYRYNTVILEIGGAMEYKKHPEINESWVEYCREMNRYPQRADEVQKMFGWEKNSIHFENGGGEWLRQETVHELLDYCRARELDVIPEVPCLSHSDYLLNAHQDLAERAYDPFPDTYCPSNPATYELLFDIMDEVIEVFHPHIMQIGHDEYYSIGVCDICRHRDPADILAQDITRIHDYLAQRGIRLMFWAEKMLNHIETDGTGLGGAERFCKCARNTLHHIPATYTAIDRIPHDCIAHHWYWALREEHDQVFLSRKMDMTYGNWDPRGFVKWKERVAAGVLGAALSHWTTVDEVTMQRNGVLMSIVYGAYLFWQDNYTDDQYDALFQICVEELYLYHNRKILSGPHLEFTHMTTIWQDHIYISSVPMDPQHDLVGQYRILFQSGRELKVPIYYGINIMNLDREWVRTKNNIWDCYDVDASLTEVTASTLPILQPDGTTQFRFVVENPWPDDLITNVIIEKTTKQEGEIFLTGFTVRQSFAGSTRIPLHVSEHRVKTPLY